ncbi:TonB-dependent receptor [Flaviaesturariibacter aridisoli]|uniref:TonB-dependent receptor n=1 Tax=Flaviaesturariibacter aridisoli TaxID=2545761 RepID=A0A4R4E2Q3_9BACT|nr:TonB-dependent receptor [Flaviaesturariibacter aridisoli]TCZ73679.1 TonB-dependent receptor [Flaviaesturariibacter aridisoli]
MKFFQGIVLLLLAFTAGAQSRTLSLTGRITDAGNGAAIPGASLYFSDTHTGTSADSNGYFRMERLQPGHYLAEVSSAGYTPIVIHLDLHSDSRQDFQLRPAVIENRGVIVTGVASSTSNRNTPVPVTLIRKTQLLENSSTNIIDALAKQPGVAQISTGPAISKPVIRGLGYNRVVVMNDGQRQEGQQWGDEHGIEVDELSVNRVEILKGASSLMYGSDAIAGVVHLITNVPVPEGTVRANAFSSYQTNNGQVGLNASLSGNRKGFSWNSYGSYKTAADYRNRYDGRVLNSRFNERNFGGYLGLNKQWGYSHLIVSSFNQNLGLVEGLRDPQSGAFLINPESPLERPATESELRSRTLTTPYQNVQHYRVTSDNSFRAGHSRIKLNLGYQQNIRREFGDAEAPKEASLHFDLRTLSYNLQWHLPEQKGFQPTVGVSGMYQRNRNRGEEVIIPEYNLFDIGGFVYVQKTIPHAVLSGGVRYDHRALDAFPFAEGGQQRFSALSRGFGNVSGSLGISYTPNSRYTFRLNAARGFRAPALSELASNGAHEGTNRYEYGRADLGSERSSQLDAGVEVDYDHISFSASAFYNHLPGYIYYQRLQTPSGADSVLTINGVDLEAFQYGQHDAWLAGFELSTDLHPHPLDWLHFENSFSLVRGRFTEPVGGDYDLPSIPAAHFVNELRVTFPKSGKRFRSLYGRVELDNTFRQNHPFAGYNTETATPSYSLLNAGFGGELVRKGRTLFSLHVSGNNLTDVAYQSHLSRLKYTDVNAATGRRGVFNVGRSFSVKLNVPMEWKLKK